MRACRGCDQANELARTRPFPAGSEIHFAAHDLHQAVTRLLRALGHPEAADEAARVVLGLAAGVDLTDLDLTEQ